MTISERRLGWLDIGLVTLPLVGLLLVALTHVLDVRSEEEDTNFISTFEGCDCFPDIEPPLTCFDRSDREACLRDELADQVDAYLTGAEGHRAIPYRR